MNIIGIGGPGCKIAADLAKYPQYDTFFIDTKNTEKYKNFYKVKEQASHEDYENNYKKLDFKNLTGETTIVLCGSGKISGIILRVLEQLKHLKPNIIYVKSDLSMADDKARTRDKIVFGILQEYARCDLLSNFYIFSNLHVEATLENIPLSTYWQQINSVISSTYNMLNYFQKTEPLLNSLAKETQTSKVLAPGIVRYSDFSEKTFYDLQNPRMKKYFFGISEKTLQEKKNLLTEIRDYVKKQMGEKCNACFAIYSTTYEQDYVYTLHYASLLQEQNIS